MAKNEIGKQNDTLIADIALVLVLIFAFAVLMWFVVPTNVPISEPAWGIALLYILFILVALPAAMIDLAFRYKGKGDTPITTQSYGTLSRLSVGIFLAFVLWGMFTVLPWYSNHQALSFSSFEWFQELGLSGISEYFFTTDIAPLVEETIRFFLIPSTAFLMFLGFKSAKKPIPLLACYFVAIFLIWNPVFAYYHYGVLKDQTPGETPILGLTRAYVYGCGFSVVNLVTGTAGFSIVYHKLHNTFGYLVTAGVPDVPLWFALLEIGLFAGIILTMFSGFGVIYKNGGKIK
jgi:hypothetical protein